MISNSEKREALDAVIEMLQDQTISIHSVNVEAVWKTVGETDEFKAVIDTGVRNVFMTFIVDVDPTEEEATVAKGSDDETSDPLAGFDIVE